MKEIKVILDGSNKKVAIIASRFNELIVEQLVRGAVNSLTAHGVDEEAITLVHVPGAYEIPLAAKKFATSGNYDFIVALGCVIRGATDHYDLVCKACTDGISAVQLETGVPVGFGVITTENLEQALERAGSKAGNKGADAALAALEMSCALKIIGPKPQAKISRLR